ncbi:MAG: hypothetical protein HUJ91_05675 [Bacteroidales bacterium]|nr:hypothetical protein [Bacteroidales bacterium]
MKKLFAIAAALVMTLTAANAQDYSKAIGIEGGLQGIGITYKQFLNSGHFMDYKANAYLGDGFGVNASATFDWNMDLGNNFAFFYGFGAGAGFMLGAEKSEKNYLQALGFGNIGIEYAFATIPFAVSLDWNPGVHLDFKDKLESGLMVSNAGFGVKYTF